MSYAKQTTCRIKSNKKLSDKELISILLKQNDSSVYDELWNRYREPIKFLLVRMLNNRLDAEELTSESICKAFLNIKKFDFKYCFSTWLYRIATNSAIDFMRKKKLKTESIYKFSKGENREEYELAIKDNNLNPIESMISNEVAEIVNSAIDDLDDNFAQLVRAKHLLGKTYVEIAEEFNVPIGTAKTHIFRATKRIKKSLKEKKDLSYNIK